MTILRVCVIKDEAHGMEVVSLQELKDELDRMALPKKKPE